MGPMRAFERIELPLISQIAFVDVRSPSSYLERGHIGLDILDSGMT